MTSRVLVVDDIAANVRLLESRLQAEYFDVRTALSGREALDVAEKERVDLVLLDVMMPDMTGFEVCAQAEGQSAHRARAGRHGHLARQRRGPGEGTGMRRRRFPDQAGQPRRASDAGEEPVAAEDDDRRAGASRRGAGVGRTEPPPTCGSTMPRSAGASSSSTTGRTPRARSARRCNGRSRSRSPSDPAQAVERAASGSFDLIMISASLKAGDGLRLCTQIRTIDGLRQTPVVLITDAGADAAGDAGARPWRQRLHHPADRLERAARTRRSAASAQALSGAPAQHRSQARSSSPSPIR